MKRKHFALFVAGLALLAGSVAGQSIHVTSPNGGEHWRQGSCQIIKWTVTDIPQGAFKITLWRNGTLLGVVATGLLNPERRFKWTVGKLITGTVPFGPGYKIKVKVQEVPFGDESDNPFFISAAPPATDDVPTTAKEKKEGDCS